jgi:hypothetical protein
VASGETLIKHPSILSVILVLVGTWSGTLVLIMGSKMALMLMLEVAKSTGHVRKRLVRKNLDIVLTTTNEF